jgi:3'(2'), 5'-bisphosphate nucleotidase
MFDPLIAASYVCSVVEEANQLVLKLRNEGLAVTHKRDGSVVTNADYSCEAFLQERLVQQFPLFPFRGEESMTHDGFRNSAERFWLVDPVDSTSSYVKGSDEFAILVALIEGSRPILGIVGAPEWNEVFVGVVPAGVAYRKHAQSAQCPIQCRAPEDPPLVLFSSNMGFDIGQGRGAIPSHAEYQKMNSALKFVQVAQGEADYYPRGDRLGEYDVAAGDALIHAAGGSLTDWLDKPLIYTGEYYASTEPFISLGLKN